MCRCCHRLWNRLCSSRVLGPPNYLSSSSLRAESDVGTLVELLALPGRCVIGICATLCFRYLQNKPLVVVSLYVMSLSCSERRMWSNGSEGFMPSSRIRCLDVLPLRYERDARGIGINMAYASHQNATSWLDKHQNRNSIESTGSESLGAKASPSTSRLT